MVLFITFHEFSSINLNVEPDAMTSFLRSIAFELTGRVKEDGSEEAFEEFLERYSNFDAVKDWLRSNKVILLIDELNMVPHTSNNYKILSALLDGIVRRAENAILYSTHHRDTQSRDGYCWPPFMVARTSFLGKPASILKDIDEMVESISEAYLTDTQARQLLVIPTFPQFPV